MVANETWSFPVLWFGHHPELAVGAMLVLLAATCLLTWLDPIIRARHVPPLLAMSGWASMAVLPRHAGGRARALATQASDTLGE